MDICFDLITFSKLIFVNPMLPKWITPMIIGIITKMLIKNYHVEVISVSGIGLGRSKLHLELNYVLILKKY